MECAKPFNQKAELKGTVPRDFLLQVFFMNQFPPNPGYTIRAFKKFAKIFAAQGAPLVLLAPVANGKIFKFSLFFYTVR
jgi:hypothetical protein